MEMNNKYDYPHNFPNESSRAKSVDMQMNYR